MADLTNTILAACIEEIAVACKVPKTLAVALREFRQGNEGALPPKFNSCASSTTCK